MGCTPCIYLKDRSCIENMIFHEDRNFLAYINDISVSTGNCTLINKKHVPLSAFSADEAKKFGGLVVGISKALREYLAPLNVKDVAVAGWGAEHLYCHILPLYTNEKISDPLTRQCHSVGPDQVKGLVEFLQRRLKPHAAKQ